MTDLVGRDQVLAAADAALARASAGHGTLVVVSGPRGAGRSAVLRAVSARADAAGHRVVAAAAGPFDREAGLGLIRRLLLPLVDEQPGLLEGGPASWAARLFTSEPGEADHIAVSQGLLAVIGRLTDHGRPLAIVADDVDLGDRSSIRLLAELARGSVDLPVLIAVSATGPRLGSPVTDLLAVGAHLTLDPLDVGAISDLAALRLGSDVRSEVVEALATASGGYPAILVPIVEALGGSSVRDEPASAIQVADIERVAPTSMPAHVEGRLRLVSEPARNLAVAVAVVGGRARADVAAAAASIEPDQVAVLVAELVDAGLFRAGTRPAWTVPVLARAAVDLVPPGERALIEIGAARALAAAGDPAEQGASLLVDVPAVGEPWAAAALAAAAVEAEQRGAPEVAKDLWLRQLEEPLDFAARGWATAAVARAEMHLGDPAGAERLRSLAPLVDDAALRSRVEFAAGRASLWNGDAAVAAACFADAASSAGAAGDDQIERRSAAGRLLACGIGSLGPDAVSAARTATGPLDDSAGSSSLRAALAFADLVEGRPMAQVLAGARAAVADDRLFTLPTSDFTALSAAAFCLVAGGEPRAAVSVLDRVIAAGHHLGQVATVATVQCGLASALLAAGEVGGAIDSAEAALASGHAWPIERPAAAAALAEARRLQGDLDTATAALAEDAVPIDATLLRSAQLQWLIVSGRVALDRGDAEAAVQLAGRALAAGPVATSLGADVLLIRSLVASGAPQQGCEHADAVLAQTDALRDSQRGVIEVLRGRLAGDLDAIEAGVDAVGASGAALDQVEVLTVLGDELLRLGRRSEARDAFRGALALADDLGAKGLASSALDGLRLAGGRPRRRALTGRTALTPAEERICELVASGRSNPEVADLLYLSRKTVEYHLGNAYGKLGITRREELAAVLAPPDGSAPLRP